MGNKYEKADFWARKAKSEGYPARSVYKLEEILNKFKLISHNARRAGAFSVLDLGAAPGSWSLFVLRHIRGAALTACDIAPLNSAAFKEFGANSAAQSANSAVRFCEVTGDFTTEEIRAALLERSPFDIVLCDAAPATSGNRALDVQRSFELANTALDYASAASAAVIKFFQGEETRTLLMRAKTMFRLAANYKPSACRSSSFETYLVCSEPLQSL